MLAVLVACTCSASLGQLVIPEDGATDVAVNAQILVIGDQPAADLRPVDGVAVPVAETRWNRVFGGYDEDWLVLTPVAALDPSTTYIVSVSGVDQATFTTGAMADDQPPVFAGLEALTALVFAGDGSSCWTEEDALHALELGYDQLPSDLLYGVLTIRRESELEPFATVPVRNRPQNENFPEPRVMSTTRCGPTPPALVVGETYCATLTAYDGAGNPAGGDQEVCAVAQACAPIDTLYGACEPVPPESGACSAGGPGLSALLLLVLLLTPARRLMAR